MFGGFDGTNDLVDTWVYDGATWTLRNVGGPEERYGAALVHDPKRHVTVMFGGWNDYFMFPEIGQLDDTWEWDGSKWTPISSSTKPPPREFAAAAYDPKRGVIIVACGDNQSDGILADTWTYDGQWHNVTPAGPHPAVRSGAMVWDPVGQRILLVGGYNSSLAPQQTVWAWDGSTWANLGTAPPQPRGAHALANTGSNLVMFGGYTTGSALLADTWTFKSSWSQIESPGLPPRVGRRQRRAQRRRALLRRLQCLVRGASRYLGPDGGRLLAAHEWNAERQMGTRDGLGSNSAQ